METIRADAIRAPRRLLPTLLGIEVLLTPLELFAALAPLSLFVPLARTRGLLFAAAPALPLIWAAVAAVWLRPLLRAIRPHRAAAAYALALIFPTRALLLRLGLWGALAGASVVHLAATGVLRGLPLVTVLSVCLVHSLAVSLLRWALQKWLLRRALWVMQLEPSWIELQAATLRARLTEVALVLGAITAGFLALFVYLFVPLAPRQYALLETYFPGLLVLLGVLWFFGLLPRQVRPLLDYLRAGARAAADRDVLHAACAAAHRLPAQLALSKLGFFGIGGLLVFAIAVGLCDFTLAQGLLLFGAIAIVTVGTAIYELIWSRAVLRPVVAHLMAQPGADQLETRAPSLRRKLLSSFGGVLIFTVALPVFWTYLQFGQLSPPALFFYAAILCIAVGVVLLTGSDLTRPLAALEQRATEMAQGKLDQRVLPGGEFDEIGRLTVAFESMRRALLAKIRTIEQLNVGLEEKVQLRTAELERANGELRSTIAALTDAQRQLVVSEKLASVGQLVAGIAHEINNPVNAILNTVEPLAETARELAGDAPLDARQRRMAAADVEEMLRVILSGAQRTQRIVQALRNYARQDAESPSRMDLAADIEETLTLLQHSLRGVVVRRELAPCGELRVYRGQLNQALVNLVSNAAAAVDGQEGAEITIRAAPRGERVTVEVRDNGPGIPEHVLPRIFDPFFTTKEVGKGTGLGLSITHRIVERHGGTITVESRRGEGATFCIEIPRDVTADPADAVRPDAPRPDAPADGRASGTNGAADS